MRIRDELIRAAHRADTGGMDEAQARTVTEAVLDKLIDSYDRKPDHQGARSWLREVRDGMA